MAKTQPTTKTAAAHRTALPWLPLALAVTVALAAVFFAVMHFGPARSVDGGDDLPATWRASATVQRAKPVEILAEAPPAKDFVAMFRQRHTPLLIRKSFIAQWPAFSRWTWEYLAKRVGEADAYVQDVPLNKHWLNNTRMEKLLQLTSEHQLVAMSADKLFQRVQQSTTRQDYCYWSSRLDYYPDLQRDVTTAPLSVAPDGKILSNVWVSSKGLVVQAHYDLYSNFLCQIKGRKKILLFPPTDKQAMYLYPKNHPHARCSQVNVLQPDLDRHPDFAQASPLVLTLDEGEALYIPPFWFHFIESLDPALSVNAFSFTTEISRAAKAYNVRPKVDPSWSLLVRARGTQTYLARIVRELQAPGSTVADFSRDMIRARLEALEVTSEQRAGIAQAVDCASEVVGAADVKALSLYEAAAKTNAPEIVRMLSEVDATLRPTLLEDYVQDMVELALGSQYLLSFLRQCLF